MSTFFIFLFLIIFFGNWEQYAAKSNVSKTSGLSGIMGRIQIISYLRDILGHNFNNTWIT